MEEHLLLRDNFLFLSKVDFQVKIYSDIMKLYLYNENFYIIWLGRISPWTPNEFKCIVMLYICSHTCTSRGLIYLEVIVKTTTIRHIVIFMNWTAMHGNHIPPCN